MEPIDSDLFLLKRIARQDSAAYRMLVGRYLDFCVRFAERMTGSRADAEDVAQEVCLKIWREAPNWQPKAKFSTWLYRVVLNASIDYKRKVVPFAPLGDDVAEDPAPASDAEMIRAEKEAAVRAALQRLPERQRAAVVMSYYEGLGNKESAEAMGLELGAFQQLLFRARQSLKQDLAGYLQETKRG